VRVIAVVAALVTGCFHPRVASEVPCGPNGECPNGQTCDDSRQPPTCVPPGDIADAAPDAAPIPHLCGDTSGVQAGPWPLVHGCPTNVGRSAFLGPASGATMVEPTGANHNTRGAVVGANGHVIVQERTTGLISLFDGKTGTPGWVFMGTNGAGLEPTVALGADNLVYATTNYGKVYVVDYAAGTEAWETQQSGAFSAPVMAAPGTIYFGAQAPYGFYALDTTTHMKKWHFDVPNMGDARTAPAVGNGRIYFTDTVNSILYALDAETGTLAFAVPVSGTAKGSAVLAGDTVYVATATNGVAAFVADTGAAIWQEPSGVGVVQPAITLTGNVVTVTADGHAFILDHATGNTRHTMMLGGKPQGVPVIDAADAIFFGTDAGAIAFSPTGELRWQSALAGPIVLGDNAVVVLPAQNTLAVIGQ
jgi:outer membrane protein assembly factor BamB